MPPWSIVRSLNVATALNDPTGRHPPRVAAGDGKTCASCSMLQFTSTSCDIVTNAPRPSVRHTPTAPPSALRIASPARVWFGCIEPDASQTVTLYVTSNRSLSTSCIIWHGSVQ